MNRYMYWAETNEMFVVKTIQSAERSRFDRLVS